MAQRHFLSLDIIPSNNDTSLHLFDSSQYSPSLAYTCPKIEITVPGFFNPRVIIPTQNFNLAVNAITLKLVAPNVTELPPLQDGIYTIKYSISPNDKVWVEYYHLRDTSFQNRLYKERCKLRLSNCEPSGETQDKLLQLREIEDYIKAAKAKVEFCNNIEQGMDLFNYAKHLLSKLSRERC